MDGLRFRPDGSFRILYFSDFQETRDHCDSRTLSGVDRLLEQEKPDLVVLCGDNCNGPAIHSAEDLKCYLAVILEPILRRHLPWCHVFGNHDYDAAVPPAEQLAIYRSFPGCMTDTAKGIPGVTNFMLPLLSTDGSRILGAVWGMDTGNRVDGGQLPVTRVGENFTSGPWDFLRFEQLMWYWHTSRQLEAAAGKPVPGFLACHIPLWEFAYLRTYPQALGAAGEMSEPYNLGALNSGALAAFVQRGDIKAVCCGHTHCNTCAGDYCGIKLCSVGSAGYSAYGEDALRGGRVIDLNAENPGCFTTRMVYFDNLFQ